MPTQELYLTDAYLREFDARVVAVHPGGVVLDRTAFHPTGGGQPADAGLLRDATGRSWEVADVVASASGVLHHGEGTPPPVDEPVHGAIDWNRRYAYMRYHTCLHILSGVVFHRFGSDITGGQIYPDRARMDLSIPNFDRAVADEIVAEVNSVVGQGLPVEVRWVPRDELRRNPGLVRVDTQLLPDVETLRVIDIHGFDAQADGGTHVRSTGEVGPVTLQRIENKGARNKRLYLTLGPSPSTSP